MLVIGLAGGVASGKSLVARCFEHLGATVLDADRIGHEVLGFPEVIAAIVSQWGKQVLNDGEIDRSCLARIVFDSGPDDVSQLKKLEQITHPPIGLMIRQRLSDLERESILAVVIDAPVMFKAGWDQLCDKIVFVDSDISIRQRRAIQRGWSPDELHRRESFQTPIDEKRSRSTDLIDNSQSKAETFHQARQLWRQWNLPLPSERESSQTLFPN